MTANIRTLHAACSDRLYLYSGFAAAVAVYDTVGKLHKYAEQFISAQLSEMKQADELPELIEYYTDNAISLLWDTVEWLTDAGETSSTRCASSWSRCLIVCNFLTTAPPGGIVSGQEVNMSTRIDSGSTKLSDVLRIVADAECELFHLAADNPDNEQLRAAAKAARAALESFAAAVGIKQDSPRLY